MDSQDSQFRFQFQIAYDDVVEAKLYAVETHGLELPHHALQRKSETSYVCLLCRAPVPTIERQVLSDHFDHHKVTKRAAADLEAYHEAFLKLDAPYQLQQVFYLPFMLNKLDCQVCRKHIPLNSVLSHCNGIDHAANAKKHARDYWPDALASINEPALAAKLERLTLKEANTLINPEEERSSEGAGAQKRSLVFTNSSRRNSSRENRDKISLQCQLQQIESKIDYNSYEQLFNYKCNQLNFCILCQGAVTQESYAEHLSAVKHKEPNEQTVIYQAAKKFHLTFSTKRTKKKDKTCIKYFVPATLTRCKCLICKKKVAFVDIREHFQVPCRIVKEDNLIYNVEIDFVKKREALLAEKAKLLPYTKEATTKFYSPQYLFELALSSSGLGMDTMQMRVFDGNHEETLFCLLCQCHIAYSGEYVQDVKAVTHHGALPAHVLNAHSKTRINLLYDYHRYFVNADQQVQMLQDCVNIQKYGYECRRCHLGLSLSNFVKHLESCKFEDVLHTTDATHALNLPKNEVKAKSKSEVKAKRPKSKSEVISVVPAEQAVQQGVKSLILDAIVVPLPDASTQLESLCYDDDTLMALYPTCNTPRGQRRPDILTMQMRSEFEKFCLACGCSVYTRGMDHLSSERHTEAVAARRVALRAYHAFWMSQSPELQLHQVHFNPQSESSLKCIGCFRKATFQQMRAHGECVAWIQRRNAQCVVPEEFAAFELDYEWHVVRRFFYGPQYDLSRDILGTHMPIVYVCKRYFFCLLCYDDKKGVFIRDVERWRAHLYKFHCTPNAQRNAQLQRVLEFHQFWAGQTAERQAYLCRFTLRPAGVLCECNQRVQLQEAVEHIEGDTCPILEDEKRREMMQQPRDGPANGDNTNDTNRKVHTIEAIFPEPAQAVQGESIKLPVYFKQHEAHFTHVPASKDVHCKVCDLSMRNDALTLRHHIGSAEHGQKSRKATKSIHLVYNCDVCMLKQRAEWKWLTHLESPAHQKMVQSMPEPRRADMKEFYCHGCNCVIFGDKISLIRHDVSGASSTKKQTNTLTASMKELLKTRTRIKTMAKELHDKCARFQQESQAKVDQCIGDLEVLIRQTYPKCRIYQFGSRVSGFVFEDSDLDLFVDVDEKYLGNNLDYHGERKIVLEVKKLLKLDPITYVDLHTVLSARVPIAKVVHAPTELDCDLSFINGLSVENSRLIRFYADLQPIFAEAMLVLKEWGYRMSTKLKNDMTSYSLCMMVIFSMQLRGYLPSVHQLRELTTFEVPNITGWDTVDYTSLDREALVQSLKQPGSVADVILNFFKYYGFEFQYSKMVVCPLLGHTFPVKMFENKGQNTPPEMHTYREKVAVDPDAQFRVSGANLFVQDPFDLGHNVTKLANRKFVNTFEKLCRLSHEHIGQ